MTLTMDGRHTLSCFLLFALLVQAFPSGQSVRNANLSGRQASEPERVNRQENKTGTDREFSHAHGHGNKETEVSIMEDNLIKGSNPAATRPREIWIHATEHQLGEKQERAVDESAFISKGTESEDIQPSRRTIDSFDAGQMGRDATLTLNSATADQNSWDQHLTKEATPTVYGTPVIRTQIPPPLDKKLADYRSGRKTKLLFARRLVHSLHRQEDANSEWGRVTASLPWIFSKGGELESISARREPWRGPKDLPRADSDFKGFSASPGREGRKLQGKESGFYKDGTLEAWKKLVYLQRSPSRGFAASLSQKSAQPASPVERSGHNSAPQALAPGEAISTSTGGRGRFRGGPRSKPGIKVKAADHPTTSHGHSLSPSFLFSSSAQKIISRAYQGVALSNPSLSFQTESGMAIDEATGKGRGRRDVGNNGGVVDVVDPEGGAGTVNTAATDASHIDAASGTFDSVVGETSSVSEIAANNDASTTSIPASVSDVTYDTDTKNDSSVVTSSSAAVMTSGDVPREITSTKVMGSESFTSSVGKSSEISTTASTVKPSPSTSDSAASVTTHPTTTTTTKAATSSSSLTLASTKSTTPSSSSSSVFSIPAVTASKTSSSVSDVALQLLTTGSTSDNGNTDDKGSSRISSTMTTSIDNATIATSDSKLDNTQDGVLSPSTIPLTPETITHTDLSSESTTLSADATSTPQVTQPSSSQRDTSAAVRVSAVDVMTPLVSKFAASSTRDANIVSPTGFPHKRTMRSTEDSSSGTPTQPATHTNSSDPLSTSASTSTTEPRPVTGSPPDRTSTESSAPTTTTTPSITQPPLPSSSSDPTRGSSSVSAEDLFGTGWATDTQEPQPEAEGYPEPDQGKEGEEEEEEEPASEPGPDWVVAKMVWQGAWEVHLYVYACLFGVLGVYTLVCVLRLWRIHRLLSRRYFVSLNLLMLLLCATRAIYLSVDGYNSNGTFHPSLDYFLYSISFPCLTSAFSIQLYALLQATKMQFLPPTIQKMSLLMTMVVVHFAISIVTDVVVGLYAGMEIMLFVCQLFFILWGLFLFFGYAYIFRRLYVHAVKRQKNVVQRSNSLYASAGGLAKPKAKFTLSVAVKVTFSTAILGLVNVALELYAIVGVYKTFSDDRPEPWPWYMYHTALRLVEFLMCATMSYVASQPFRYRRGRQACCCPVLCAPCAEICCCGADVNQSDGQAAWSDMDHQQLRASMDRGQPLQLSYHQYPSSPANGHAHRGSKGSGGEGDLATVVGKGRICFSESDDIKPIITSQPVSRPASEVVENSNPPSFPGSTDATTTTTTTGVVNTGYLPTVEKLSPSSPTLSQSPTAFKSRKSSIASSEFFLGQSVSLADSMASELDKAFRSMHEDGEEGENCSTSPSRDRSRESSEPPPTNDEKEEEEESVSRQSAEHFSPQKDPQRPKAVPDSAPRREEEGLNRKGEESPNGAWHQKLFRTCSGGSGGGSDSIRTKDVDKATYMSLLDIERTQAGREQTQTDPTAPPTQHHEDPYSTSSQGEEDPAAGRPRGLSSPERPTCVEVGEGKRTSSLSSPSGTLPSSCENSPGGGGVSSPHGNTDGRGDHPRSKNDEGSEVSSPVTQIDVSSPMTSVHGPYRTVIPVGGGGRRGIEGATIPPPSSSPPVPFATPVFSSPHSSAFGPAFMTSPNGRLTYGDVEEDDDLEV